MCMIDLKLDANWDLELSAAGDISKTDSIVQAVRIRLLWFSRSGGSAQGMVSHTSRKSL